jgi:hypothetical protein
MKAGARSLGRDVAERVKSSLGGGAKPANVWETATTEAPGGEPPECQWCPICRAARRYRESGGTGAGLSSQLPRVGDTLAGFAQDAFSLFEAAMRAQQRPATRTGAPGKAGDEGPGSDYGTVVGPGVAWPTAVHAEDEDGEAADESGHREEGGEPGDVPPDSSGDEQVEGPAE